MISKLKTFLGGEPDTRPALGEGEEIVLEGRAERVRFFGYAGWGFFVLTNRRLLWHEPAVAVWSAKWCVRELDLGDIAAVDRGNLVHFLLGGRRLRLRLRDGSEYLFQGGIEDDLAEWIAVIREAGERARGRQSEE
jgi:hypothetical protein